MELSGGHGFGTRAVVVAAVAATTQIALTVAYTSLAFRDQLADDLGLGLASMFLGLLIAALVGALRSGLGGHVLGPQDSGLVVLSVAVPTIVAATEAPGETLIVLMGLGSAAVGLTLLLLGRFGWGRSVRYLPYPVLAGFLAGTGLVMGWSAIGLAWDGVSGTAAGGSERWLRLGVALAVTLLMSIIARSSIPTERALPVLVLGSIALFHVGRLFEGMDRADGAARGWLLPVLPSGPLLTNDWVSSGDRADWSVVVEQLPVLVPLLVLAPLTLLLYLGALESVLDTDLDTDAEFRVAGGVNLAVGAVGSAPAYTQFANTMLVQNMAGPNRLVPLLIGLATVPVLLVGDPIVGLVPQPVVAGMLGFIAVNFVVDWTWDLRRRVGVVELTSALVIAASIPAFGFLAGIGIGLALAVVWFVIQSGRISGVRRIGDATSRRSTVERSPAAERVLADRGGEVVIAELDGYLFFGTGDSVLRRLQARPGMASVRWLILDLGRVSGADSSAVASFGQLLRWARRSEVAVAWCHASPRVRRSLSPLLDDERGGAEFPDLDRALEATEAWRLAGGVPDVAADERTPSLLELVPELRSLARTISYQPGDAIRRVGEEGRGLTVIERGHVHVEGGPAGTRRRRLGPGAVLGELGIYRDGVAVATVIADEVCTAIEIDRAGIEELATRSPDAASRLHQHLAGIIAGRLVASDRIIDEYRAADGERD